jgi:hypothetical protein
MFRKITGDSVVIVTAADFIAEGLYVLPGICNCNGTAGSFKHFDIIETVTKGDDILYGYAKIISSKSKGNSFGCTDRIELQKPGF